MTISIGITASTPPSRRRRESPGRLRRGTFGAIDPAWLRTAEEPCQEPPEVCAGAATPHPNSVLLRGASVKAAVLSRRAAHLHASPSQESCAQPRTSTARGDHACAPSTINKSTAAGTINTRH